MRRPVSVLSLAPLPLAWMLACGGAAQEPPKSARLAEAPSASVAAVKVEQAPRGWVARASVERAVRLGLGRFLANGEVDAKLESGRFVGWRVVALHDDPDDLWKGVDLRIGDVVTAVNGFPIERPQQANRAFLSLRVASEIRVSLLRDGQAMELRFTILEEGETPPADVAPGAAPATSASVLPTPEADAPRPRGSAPAPAPSTASSSATRGAKNPKTAK